MSDLHDLEEMAELFAYGRRGIFSGPRYEGRPTSTPVCRNGHVRTEQNTRWSKPKAGRPRQRICIECRRASEGFKGIYKPRRAK